MINPDLIKVGDQVRFAPPGGIPRVGTVVMRHTTTFVVEADGGDMVKVELAGMRARHVVVDHRPA